MSETQEISIYYQGVLEGIHKYAWVKDGVQYVGCGDKTLKEAEEEVRADRRRALASVV